MTRSATTLLHLFFHHHEASSMASIDDSPSSNRDFHHYILTFVQQFLTSTLIMVTTSPNQTSDASLSMYDHGSFLSNTSQTLSFALKLSIKLKDHNFLLWNQQVQAVITPQKLHRLLVNSAIPPQYATNEDRLNNCIT